MVARAVTRTLRTSRSFLLLLTLGGSICGLGCGTTEEAAVHAPQAEGVARVGQQVITEGDIVAWAIAHRGTRQEALDALIEEALLFEEAERRGIASDPRLSRQLIVQALLEEIEQAHDPAEVTEEEIRAEYDATVARVAGQGIEVPPLEESRDPIRTLLAGRRRAEALVSQLRSLSEAHANVAPFMPRWDALLRQVEVE